jgi:hypothetical protein
MFRRSLALVLSLSAVAVLAVGCGASDEDTETGEGMLTPRDPRTIADQRKLCELRVAENSSQRQKDLDTGVVRWQCGDVKGVDASDGVNEFGQEYCEFHAVQEGKVVDKVAKSNVKAAKVECLFTGVYGDVKGEPGSAKNKSFGEALNTKLTDGKGNLSNAKGVKIPALGANPFSVMNGDFNTRNAASSLLRDCQNQGNDAENAKRVNATPDACSGANCVSKRDVEACTLILGFGKGWRNSDPVICGRAARGAMCGAQYSELPAGLDGFIMTDWEADLGQAVKLWTGKSTEAPSAPDRCRYATVDGKPYLHVLICQPSEKEVAAAEGNLQPMCSKVFGPKIAMTAPVGLVAKLGTNNAGFCGAFNKGAKALQAVAAAK